MISHGAAVVPFPTSRNPPKGTSKMSSSKSDASSPDNSPFIGELSSRRQQSTIRYMFALYSSSGKRALPFHSGMPNPMLFPFRKAEFELETGHTIDIEVGLSAVVMD